MSSYEPLNHNAMTTVAKVKSYLGITSATHDTILTELVANVTAWMTTYLDRTLLKKADGQYFEEIFDGYDKCLLLKEYPIVSVTSIEYNSGTQAVPVWNTVDASNYVYDAQNGYIELLAGLPNGRQNVRVRYNGGYASYPDDVELVAKQLVARMFEQRKAQGKTSEQLGTATISWNTTITDEQKLVLGKYKTITV